MLVDSPFAGPGPSTVDVDGEAVAVEQAGPWAIAILSGIIGAAILDWAEECEFIRRTDNTAQFDLSCPGLYIERFFGTG